MNLRLFNLIFFLQWLFTPNIVVNAIVHRKQYLPYLIEVVNHLRDQKGWSSIENVYIKMNSKKDIDVNDLLSLKANEKNIGKLFGNIVYLLNFKYNETLETFVQHMDMMIDECEKYLANSLSNMYVDCAGLLEIDLKKSSIMFRHMYKAMSFLSYLDVQRVDPNIRSNPLTIVDDIFYVAEYTNSELVPNLLLYTDGRGNPNVPKAFNFISKIKKFTKEIAVNVQNASQNMKHIIESSMKIDLKSIFEKEFQFVSNNYVDFICFISDQNEKLYNYTVKNYYQDLGFDALINPRANWVRKLIPPQDKEISQNLGIASLNKLLEGNWKTTKQISIIYNEQKISAQRILRDLADDNNFHLKKHYITQLLKCRFIVLLSNFHSYFGAVLHIEIKEETLNTFSYIENVNHLFEIVKSSQEFFISVLKAIDILKQSYIWHVTYKQSCLYKIDTVVKRLLRFLKDHNLTRDVFVNENGVDLETIADKYIENIKNFKYVFSNEIYSLKDRQKKICSFEEDPFLRPSRALDVSHDKRRIVNHASPTENQITLFEQACTELYMLYENFVSIEYRDLGFEKFNSKLSFEDIYLSTLLTLK